MLLWYRVSVIILLAHCGNGVKGSLSCNEMRIKLIQSQEDISRLNVAIAVLVAKNSNEVKSRINALETDFNLKKNLAISLNEIAIDELIDFHRLLSEQIDNMKIVIQTKSDEDLTEHYPSVIAADIKGRLFAEAEMKLFPILSTYRGVCQHTIHEVYANNIGNFGLILQFAEHSHHTELVADILLALWNEMIVNDHRNDPQKLISLIDLIENKVIKQGHIADNKKQEVSQMRDMILVDVKKICFQHFKAALLSDKCYINSDIITKFSNQLKTFRPSLVQESIHDVIDDIYSYVKKTELLTNIYESHFIPNVVDALAYTYKKMNESNERNDPGMFVLLDQMTKLRKFTNLPAEQRSQIATVIFNLPEPLQVLHSAADSVCLKNVEHPEYMYAGDPVYDESRRHVLTWIPGWKDKSCVWMLKKTGPANEFVFRSLSHSSEYLFISMINLNTDYHHVFTWIPGGAVENDPQGKMRLTLHGNTVTIKNVYENYLCLTKEVLDADRRYILSPIRQKSIQPACQWILEDCSTVQ